MNTNNKSVSIVQNPDKLYALEVRKRLRENDGYCPCALEKAEDNKCMCREFRDMIKRGEIGTCHCGLYIIQAE